MMIAIEFLKQYHYLPVSATKVPFCHPSNSELRRWLKDKAVLINGVYPNAGDEIAYPIKELIFFPKGKRRTTIIKETA